MIDPSGMDNKVKKWWESRREEILRSRMFCPRLLEVVLWIAVVAIMEVVMATLLLDMWGN
jgi:hypothetical protein